MKIILTLCSLLCVNYVSTANIRVDPLVLISQGLVRGQQSSNGDYSEFLGIPYASVNSSNPFGESIEHEGFGDSVFYAYDGSMQCAQDGVTDGVLDCLTLNIYVPESANSNNPMPVYVWIYGGAFTGGSASSYGPQYLVSQGLVVVTFNYRVGPYGFFCLDSPLVPGNQGLKDQLAALRWVKSNIAAFGGNPNNVTLGGQSAGSISAELHLYSSAEKLFDKAILESGVAQTAGEVIEGDREAAIKIAAYLGLNTNSTDTALEFLTSASPTLVIAAGEDLKIKWRPCVEKSFSGVTNFITTYPSSMSNPTKLSGMPILIGHTFRETQVQSATDTVFYETLNDTFSLPEETMVAQSDIIRHFYIGDDEVSDRITTIQDFVSDFAYVHPVSRAVTKLIDETAGPVYEYLFTYDTTGNGAKHTAELDYLFEMSSSDDTSSCSTPTDLTEEQVLLRDRITTLWGNFIKTGNPTPSTSDLIPITWEAVSDDKRPYLVIDANLTIENRIFHERVSMWDMFYSVFGDQSLYITKCSL